MKKKKQKTSDKARHGFFNTVIALVIKALLRLRYRVTIRGLDDISSRGRKGILFLPSHPALIDPVIMLSVLYRDFGPRSIADEFRMRKRFVKWLSKRFGTRTIPGVARTGGAGADAIMSVLSKSMEDLRNGENILLYPGGHLKRSRSEEIGATSAVQIIANSLPQVRVVLVRQMGLWGSSFSWSSGRSPDFVLALKQNLKNVLRNGIFFSPRRPVEIEFVEPDSFPRDADRITINRFMEDFYNTVADPNTYVPYLFWQDRKISIRPEPELLTTKGEIDSVSETTKKLVVEYLEELTGQSALSEKQSLAYDLGMDSLAIVEIVLWLEKEFGFQQVDTGSLKTVADVMIAAAGKGVSSLPALLKPVSAKWHSRSSANRPLCVSEGKTVCEIFLKQAKCSPDKLVICDQSSGEKTYRDIITAIIALKPFIEALPGVYIGIMLPASVGATICYLAGLFAGKTPVMLNWTVGSRNMVHSLNLLGVKHVLTAQALVTRLATQGTNLTEMNDRFVFMETVAKQVSLVSKLRAYAASRLSWSCLRNSDRTDIAVILFTSGSESLPKAVPLSHKNIIANIRDIPSKVVFRENDVMIGILPPFHSFGITTAIILPVRILDRKQYQIRVFIGGCRFHGNHGAFIAIVCKVRRYDLFDRGKRDHFASYLAEALQPAAKSQHAVCVFRYQISGVVPFPAIVFDKRRLAVVIQISGKYARTAHKKYSRLVLSDPFPGVDIDNDMFNGWHWCADRIRHWGLFRIGGDNGRAFRHAVAFEKFHVRAAFIYYLVD
jgi:long-chain-fatty-acid--[acyl-carrier-protein] ligase